MFANATYRLRNVLSDSPFTEKVIVPVWRRASPCFGAMVEETEPPP